MLVRGIRLLVLRGEFEHQITSYLQHGNQRQFESCVPCKLKGTNYKTVQQMTTDLKNKIKKTSLHREKTSLHREKTFQIFLQELGSQCFLVLNLCTIPCKEVNLDERKNTYVLFYCISSHMFFTRISAVKESENKVKEISDKAQHLETQ